MTRIILAGPSESSRTKLSGMLASSGFRVYRQCGTASELRRTLSECEDCVLVMLGLLPDCKPDDLVWDYGDRVRILLIARPSVLEDCESREIFRLPLPSSGQQILGALEMLTQLHRMSLPRRSGASRDVVEQAKSLLMEREGLSEPEAHRTLQRYAMNHGMKMADFAARILEAHRPEIQKTE